MITEVIEGIPEGVQTSNRSSMRERCPDMRPKSNERTVVQISNTEVREKRTGVKRGNLTEVKYHHLTLL
jgi:hypothetical protein